VLQGSSKAGRISKFIEPTLCCVGFFSKQAFCPLFVSLVCAHVRGHLAHWGAGSTMPISRSQTTIKAGSKDMVRLNPASHTRSLAHPVAATPHTHTHTSHPTEPRTNSTGTTFPHPHSRHSLPYHSRFDLALCTPRDHFPRLVIFIGSGKQSDRNTASSVSSAL
jgi:hypothetical protein